ncbi:MAG: efflux RND transporter periplasmic adaptor subunit [Pseudomonadota bacterium]
MVRFACIILLFVVAGCGGETEVVEPPVRGLLTITVGETESGTRRRYPGILEPKELNGLSFEVAGKLGEVDLSVGQRVSAGEVLARLDADQFEIAIENRRAQLDEAEATLKQETEDLERQRKLLSSGTVTRVAFENAETDFKTARARARQAEEALKSAEEDLENSVLTAPFDGIVNSVDVDSFATVATGAPIVSVYAASTYEVSFSVNFETVSQLELGTPATVRLADDPTVTLAGAVTELGERADAVSSFPVVVDLTERTSIIRAGMAVEVALEFELPVTEGFLIPIRAAIAEGMPRERRAPSNPTALTVYVFDPELSVVRRREVIMAGLRENRLVIISGLERGERVAVAGVSYLRDGMKVKPLEGEG